MSTVSPEILALRKEAKDLGLKPHHKAGANKIQKMIDEHFEEVRSKKLSGGVATPKLPLGTKIVGGGQISQQEFLKLQQEEGRKRIGSLMRVRITCMNPQKKDWNGEIISVGSAKLGTYKKFVPFNGEPYHIPKIIYDMLKERKCSTFYNTRDARGTKVRKSRQISEFAIELLDPLTTAELEALSKQQALAAGQGN